MEDCDLVKLLPSIEEVNKRFQSKSQSWEDYLFYLGLLPTLRLKDYSFLQGTKAEKHFCKVLDYQYTTLSRWLYYLVPGDKPLDSELFFTEKIKLKARAEISKAFLDLAVELLPRCAVLQEFLQHHGYAKPVDLWFAWELQNFEKELFDSGLITGKPILPPSKEESAKINRNLASILEGSTKPISPSSNEAEEEKQIGDIVFHLALQEAENDIYFRNCNAYVQYQKKTRSFARTIRNPGFSTFRFENGSRLPSGRKGKRKARRAG